MTNPTEAPMANAIDDVREWVLMPKEPTVDMLVAVPIAVSEYHTLLSLSPAPSQHTGWSDEAVEALRAFAESFHITVVDNTYQDVTLHLDAPHSLAIRLRNDSTKSWIFKDLETRRRAALTAASSIAPAAGFEVNDLVWERGVGNALYAYIWNERYSVHKHHGKFILIINSLREPEPFETEQAGIDAAQSHFSARILSSIAPSVPKESGEP